MATHEQIEAAWNVYDSVSVTPDRPIEHKIGLMIDAAERAKTQRMQLEAIEPAALPVKLIAGASLVHEAQLPPFKVAPRVILWGERVFELKTFDGDVAYYVECFHFVLP